MLCRSIVLACLVLLISPHLCAQMGDHPGTSEEGQIVVPRLTKMAVLPRAVVVKMILDCPDLQPLSYVDTADGKSAGLSSVSGCQTLVTNLDQLEPFTYDETTDAPPLPLCGPKALCIALDQLGLSSDVTALSKLAGTDRTGTTMDGLKRAAEMSGLRARGLRVDLAYLERMPKPSIAWIGRDHYVVITDAQLGNVEFIDPNRGRVEANEAEFGAIWSGYVLELRRRSTR